MNPRLRKIRAIRRRRRIRLPKWIRDDSGVQLVELAIVIPIFVMLFAATAEFGRYFYEYTTLAKSARAGARYLASHAVNSTEDQNAMNVIVYGNTAGTGSPVLTGFSTGNIKIKREGGVPTSPETVTVEIQNFKHDPIFDLGALLKIKSLSLNIDVKPSVTMRHLLTGPST